MHNPQKKIIKNLAELEQLAVELSGELKPNKSSAVILGLSGELGSGKTAFTQVLARALGVKERVTSPTFVIEKIYFLPLTSSFKRLIHLDCYRIEKPEEIISLGWRELIFDPANLIVVEWAERIAAILPPGHRWLAFRHVDETTREVEIA